MNSNSQLFELKNRAVFLVISLLLVSTSQVIGDVETGIVDVETGGEDELENLFNGLNPPIGFDSALIYTPNYSGPIISSSGYTNSMVGEQIGEEDLNAYVTNETGSIFFIKKNPYILSPTSKSRFDSSGPLVQKWAWNSREGALGFSTNIFKMNENSHFVRVINPGEAGFASYLYELPWRNCTTNADHYIQESIWMDNHIQKNPVWLLNQHPQGKPLGMVIDDAGNLIIPILFTEIISEKEADVDWEFPEGFSADCKLVFNGETHSLEGRGLGIFTISPHGDEIDFRFFQDKFEIGRPWFSSRPTFNINSNYTSSVFPIGGLGIGPIEFEVVEGDEILTIGSELCGAVSHIAYNISGLPIVTYDDSYCHQIMHFSDEGEVYFQMINLTGEKSEGFFLHDYQFKDGTTLCISGASFNSDGSGEFNYFAAEIDIRSGQEIWSVDFEKTNTVLNLEVDCNTELVIIHRNVFTDKESNEIIVIEDGSEINRMNLSIIDYHRYPGDWHSTTDVFLDNYENIHILNQRTFQNFSEDPLSDPRSGYVTYLMVYSRTGEIIRKADLNHITNRWTYNGAEHELMNFPKIVGEHNGTLNLFFNSNYPADSNIQSFYGELIDNNAPYVLSGPRSDNLPMAQIPRNIFGEFPFWAAYPVFHEIPILERLGVNLPVESGLMSDTFFFQIEDSDNDGIRDKQDPCPNSNQTWETLQDLDRDGCHDETQDDDDDGDGIFDWEDNCPQGDIDWIPDAGNDGDRDGCQDATEDNDDDADGIVDIDDECADQPNSWQSSTQFDSDRNGCLDDDWAWWYIQEIPEVEDPTISEEPISESTPIVDKPTTLAKLKQTISTPAGIAGIGMVSLVAIAGVSIAYASGHQPLQFRLNKRSSSLGLTGLIGGIKHSREPEGIEQRSKAMALIEENPGIHQSELRRLLGWGGGQLSHHLYVLEGDGEIWTHRAGYLQMLFPQSVSRNSIDDDFMQILEETGPVEREILALIWQDGENRDLNQKAIARWIERDQKTVSRHIIRMSNLGLVTITMIGNSSHPEITALGIQVITLGV